MVQFDNEAFENLCKSVLPEEDFRLKIHGGMTIGPSDPKYDKMWQDILAKKKQEVIDMELAMSLNALARKLGVNYLPEIETY